MSSSATFSLAAAYTPDADRRNRSDKISLPHSALTALAGVIERRRGEPLVLRVETRSKRVVHGGVLDFNAAEGCVGLPLWMGHALAAPEGQFVTVSLDDVPLAESCALQPASVQFYALRDHRAALEHALSTQYTCLSTGMTVDLEFSGHIYSLVVAELAPASTCCIVNTDVDVHIIPPVDSDGQTIPVLADKVASCLVSSFQSSSTYHPMQKVNSYLELIYGDATGVQVTVPLGAYAYLRVELPAAGDGIVTCQVSGVIKLK